MNTIIRKLINRKYPLTIGVFVGWMLLFDGNSAMFIYKQYHELKDLRMQEQFLKEEITNMEEQKINLFSTMTDWKNMHVSIIFLRKIMKMCLFLLQNIKILV